MADQDPKPTQDAKPAQFPKAVYRRGSGKKGENGLVTAESRVVNSEEDLKNLGDGWVDTPQDALSGAGAKKGGAPSTEDEEDDSTSTRKGTSKR